MRTYDGRTMDAIGTALYVAARGEMRVLRMLREIKGQVLGLEIGRGY